MPGGQICHTLYMVLLYRTCPYIVPYAAISCLVLPNCHQCAAIECKSSHKIVPYAAISPSVCYIVSGVPRYANNHATTSGMHYIVPYAAISYAVKIKGLTGQRLSVKRPETALCRIWYICPPRSLLFCWVCHHMVRYNASRGLI